MLKMAKKRALVDAVLSATRSSDLFTQDMEDLKGMDPVKEAVPDEPITKPQLMKIKYLGKDLNLSREEAVKLLGKDFGAKSTQQLTKNQAMVLIKKLVAMKEAS